MKKTAAIVVAIIGIGIFVFGTHIGNEAMQGEDRIEQAEENASGGRPTLGPIRRRMQQQAAENAQTRIGNAKERIAGQQVTATWLRGTGAVLFIVGIGSFVYCCFHRKSRH